MSDHYIYIIAHSGEDGPKGPVKVGITSNLNSRIKMIQTGNPGRLEYVMTLTVPAVEMARYMERAFHHLKRDRRLSGEWFDIPPLEAMSLLCLYFDAALSMQMPDVSDEFMELVREGSGLSEAKVAIIAHRKGEQCQ